MGHASRIIEGETAPVAAGGGSRRAFLRRSAALAPGAVLAASSVASAAGPRRPRFPELFPGQARRVFVEILDDEAAHVDVIQTLLMDKDNPLNPQVRARPALRHLVQPNFQAFLQTASAFENTGSGVYAGALFAIEQTDEYFPTAAGITTVESRHAAVLNLMLNESIIPDFVPVEAPIDQTVTLSRIAPFIANLNGTKPGFDSEKASSDNNFAILDFLLLLEYIESAFYQVNVAKFFG